VFPSHHTSFPRRERRIQAPSFSRCGRHPRHAASGTTTARNVCFRAIVERSRRWSPAFHPDPSPQSQERKRKAERRQTRSPRSALRRGARRSQRARLSAFHHGACCSDLARTGHSAGRACLPEPPESGGDEPPPAGAAPLRQPASPTDVPENERDCCAAIQGASLLSKDSLRARICGDESGLYKFVVCTAGGPQVFTNLGYRFGSAPSRVIRLRCWPSR